MVLIKMQIIGKLGGLSLGDGYRTIIMGIINLSPTSFYQGSISNTREGIKRKIQELITEGADIIDVGALSSAPSFIYNKSELVTDSLEIERLETFFEVVDETDCQIPISVDTQSHKTADFALRRGASIINDISGLKNDKMMADIISQHKASVIVMACRSQPGDVFKSNEVITELQRSISIATDAGILQSNIAIDPGLGGWTPDRKTEDDYIIIHQLEKLRILQQCVLVGISRKSFIGAVVNKPTEERLWGSMAATSVAIMMGAHVVRTHDVKATKDACLITDFLKSLNKKEH